MRSESFRQPDAAGWNEDVLAPGGHYSNNRIRSCEKGSGGMFGLARRYGIVGSQPDVSHQRFPRTAGRKAAAPMAIPSTSSKPANTKV